MSKPSTFRGEWGDDISTETSLSRCRSCTILWALERLEVQWSANHPEILLEIVGADATEGESWDAVAACFREVISEAEKFSQKVRIVLTGPNAPAGLHGGEEAVGEYVVLECAQMLYEEYVEKRVSGSRRFAFCFNAGIWGYDSWRPAVVALVQYCAKVPVVITAYSATESDADEEVIDGIAERHFGTTDGTTPWYCWESEKNPFGSLHPRPSSVSDEILYDSQYVFALHYKEG